MKRVKIALTSLTLVLALAAVVVAKANEKKRATTSTAYLADSHSSAYRVDIQGADFDTNIAGQTQAALIDASGANNNLFSNTGLTTAVKFVKP